MKTGLTTFVLIFFTLAAQRLLGLPHAWPLATAVLLPMPWIVGPPLKDFDRHWYWISFAIGFGWDLLFEPIVGIGAIAWSAPALIVWVGSSVVAERRTRAWFVFGALGTLVFWFVRFICYIPLGLPGTPTWSWIGVSSLLTGAWCASINGLLVLNLPARWQQRQRRRLR